VTDGVQEVLVFVTVALAVAYLVRKLAFPGGGATRSPSKPDVPVSALRRRSPDARPRTGGDCH
jgi:hypothetical protein